MKLMKGLLVIFLAFGLIVSFSSVGLAEHYDDFGMSDEQKKEIPISKCDKYNIYGDLKTCLECHNKDLTLKELPQGIGTKFEGKIGEENGVKFIRYTINDMTPYVPAGLKDIAEYIDWHPEFKKVKIYIRSYGGSLFDCWDAIGIINEMKEKGIIVEITSYGYSMSAGFVIFTSGSIGHRFVSKTSNFMWHELRSGEWFTTNTPSGLRDKAKIFRKLQDVIHDYLVDRSAGKVTKEFLDKTVDKDELWITGKEMFENGLADRLIETKER